ncbi:MAG: dUTP diphosphatase [Ignavibacteriaceae bacterium]|nr:dUTP diphosphatase [Ignavibacteriaceae bacterium]
MENVEIYLRQLNSEFADIPIPEYATAGSSGMDLRAAVSESIILKSGEFTLVPTNLVVEIPHGYELQVRPRSGLAAKNGIGVLNGPGTIDSDYRGEIKVILFNFGKNDFTIHRGDRIAQMVLAKVYAAKITVSSELNNTARGDGGFGHSGVK